MKRGVEVRFRNKIIQVAINEPMVLSIMVEKIRGELFFRVTGFMSDTDIHHVWYYAEDLKIGDEVMIERKEIEISSEPLATYPIDPPLAKTKEELLQEKLRIFRALEKQLKEKGLI
ncbi:MAG: hypothetical protein LBN37_02525 [Bacteroidales bacterium]|jgi:hypothetical protein|nr:hypothetical protein [Bacteroidales bacterium]